MAVHSNTKFANRVPNAKRGGKPPKLGQTPYGVAIFQLSAWEVLCRMDDQPDEQTKWAKKGVLAWFNTYGDAYAYADRLKQSGQYYAVLLFTTNSVLNGLADF